MIDITKLKNRWVGEWDPQYRYVKNDVIQWKGSTYVCLRDIPLEYISSVDNMVTTTTYFAYALGVYIKTKDPRDTLYWLLFAGDVGGDYIANTSHCGFAYNNIARYLRRFV